MERDFYICNTCKNIITKLKDSKVPVVCCGEKMTKLIPGTVDASAEKHIPTFLVENNEVKVSVGSIEHPMTEEHYIEWIYLQTNKGEQFKYLLPNQKPTATFILGNDEKVECVFAYCNLHSLWKA